MAIGSPVGRPRARRGTSRSSSTITTSRRCATSRAGSRSRRTAWRGAGRNCGARGRAALGIAVSQFNEPISSRRGYPRPRSCRSCSTNALDVEPDTDVDPRRRRDDVAVRRPDRTEQGAARSGQGVRRVPPVPRPERAAHARRRRRRLAYGPTLRRFVHALGLDDAVTLAGRGLRGPARGVLPHRRRVRGRERARRLLRPAPRSDALPPADRRDSRRPRCPRRSADAGCCST